MCAKRDSRPNDQPAPGGGATTASTASTTAAMAVRGTRRQTTEARLRHLEERYRLLASAAGQLWWTADPQGALCDDLSNWLLFTGQTSARASGMGWLDALHPDDHERTLAIWTDALATGAPFEHEARVCRHDGSYRDMLWRAAPLRGADGRIREWAGCCTDITERKQLEAAHGEALARERAAQTRAEEHSRQLETIIRTITDGIYVYDTDGHLLLSNPAADAYNQRLQRQDYLDQPFLERIQAFTPRDEHGEPLTAETLPVLRVLRGEEFTGPNAVDTLLLGGDGRETLLNVSGAPIRDEAGAIRGGLIVTRDVTERRHLEQRTSQSLQALLDIARALVTDGEVERAEMATTGTALGTTPGGATQRLAELTRSVLGCERVAIMSVDESGERAWAVCAAGYSPEEERRWREVTNGGILSDGLAPEHLARLRAGEAIELSLRTAPYDVHSITPAHNGVFAPMRIRERLVGILALSYGAREHTYSGEELALAGTVATLTGLVIERERLLREREAARANALALTAANQRISEFLGIASHELNTPLTVIILSIQYLERWVLRQLSNTDSETQRIQLVIARMREQVERLARLVADVREVSAIEVGTLELERVPCDLAVLMRGAIAAQSLTHPARALRLALPEGDGVALLADAVRIEHVLTHYLSNALKFSPEETPIEVALTVEAGMARVSVRDDGPGVPTEEHERIWQLYHRAQGIEVRNGSAVGVGMGLHICRIIIERHGGQVGLESAPGQGATFWFTLPR